MWASWRYIAQENVPKLQHTNEVSEPTSPQEQGFTCTVILTVCKRALYCDTDSVIYIQPTAESQLVQTGDYLGAMTSELKPGFHIEEFLSVGPKIMPIG